MQHTLFAEIATCTKARPCGSGSHLESPHGVRKPFTLKTGGGAGCKLNFEIVLGERILL